MDGIIDPVVLQALILQGSIFKQVGFFVYRNYFFLAQNISHRVTANYQGQAKVGASGLASGKSIRTSSCGAITSE